MSFRYVPLLRSKAGETVALQQLTVQAKQRIFPLIQLVKSPPTTFVSKLSQAWPQLPLALDGLYNFGVTGSTAHFTSAMTALRHAGVLAIPSIECDSDSRYISAAQKYVTGNHPYFVIKASLGQLASLDGFLTKNGWDAGNVDLIITAGHIADYPSGFEKFVIHELKQHFQTKGRWRTVTLAASAAPKDYSRLQVGRNEVPRLDWKLWQHVHPNFDFQLDYGDYGIAHPDLDEPPGVAMIRASVSVRYATEDNWIILKGNPTTGAKGQPMPTQYLRHAKALHGDQQFDGITGCMGDQRITQIVGQSISSGSRATWVEIGVNRHVSLVAHSLP